MKIEKLTENKIRVIINDEDLKQNHTDLHTIMTKSLENQGLFLNILSKAEKEVGFYTENCKLLIEAFSTPDDLFVFTITKYSENDFKDVLLNSPKKLKVKRKAVNINNTGAIYQFNGFEEFCNFCNCIKSKNQFDITKLSKHISLYLYNNTYYLVLSNIKTDYKNIKIFYNTISEFGKFVSNSNTFKTKLLEHGTSIIKKNAISIGIKYFH